MSKKAEKAAGVAAAIALGDWLAVHYPTSEPDIAVAALATLKRLHAAALGVPDAE